MTDRYARIRKALADMDAAAEARNALAWRDAHDRFVVHAVSDTIRELLAERDQLAAALEAEREEVVALEDEVEAAWEEVVALQVEIEALRAEVDRVTRENEAMKRCAIRYLEWLGVTHIPLDQALYDDMRNPDMCGDAALAANRKGGEQ